jgi:hypothetical protein
VTACYGDDPLKNSLSIYIKLNWAVPSALTMSLLLALVGCGSSSKTPPSDAGPADALQEAGDADASSTDTPASSSDGADGVVAADAADAGAPTVVASLMRVPASLALSGSTLYVTVAESAAGGDGMVVTVAKTALAATPDGGVATLASSLIQPRAVAVDGNLVLWADTEHAFPGLPEVVTVPTTGGTPSVLLTDAATTPHLAIAGSVLYAITSNGKAISPVPLASADGGVGAAIYPGNPPSATVGADSDGTSVFFFTNGTTNLDLFSVAVGGGAVTDLSMNATSGSVDYDFLTHDTTAIYWSDSGTGTVFSLSKTAGATKAPLATFEAGSDPVQILPDGDNLYLLSSTKLMRLPKAGGTPVVLASVPGTGSETFVASLGNAVSLAVDDTFVYWLYEGNGEILKIAK